MLFFCDIRPLSHTLTLKLMECDILSLNKQQQGNKNQTDGLVDHRFNEKKRPEQKISALICGSLC